MPRKVVIPAAGSGNRLLPVTKVQPKEMLPVFCRNSKGCYFVKPVVEIVFEELYNVGLREFCCVVGRGKRSIEDHFTPDENCIKILEHKGYNGEAASLFDFYSKLVNSTILWVNQPEAKGFGNAVLLAQPFVQNERFLVHAGDSLIVSSKMDYLEKLVNAHERLGGDATFLALEIDNPKQYGIVEGVEVESDIIEVKAVVEKPENPTSNLAIMAMYVFEPVVFDALQAVSPGYGGEIQLTDAIQKLIEWGNKVHAVKLDKSYRHLDVGNPDRYWQALEVSRGCLVTRNGKV